MKKKIFALLLVVAIIASLAVGLTACNKDKEEFKVGVICLHDENSTYDKNFIDAVKATASEMGLKSSQLIIKTGIKEDSSCYEAAADLVDQGCDVIFADSFGHESFMIQAAKEFKDVEFCHATGVKAATENLANYHNSFASIYEGRYLAGIAAGMKLNAMAVAAGRAVDGKAVGADAKIGYVGAFTYAEVVSGLTSFYLGVKSVCPAVTMDVKYTGSWYDYDKEFNAASDLISSGCVLISQHADSMGAPNACKADNKNIPNVTYNISTADSCASSYLIGSKIDWSPYFEYMINQTKNNAAIDNNWTGTLATGSVKILDINSSVAAAGTQAAIDTAVAALEAGTLKVFDVSSFTVTIITGENGKNQNATVDEDGHLTAYNADVDGDYVGETNAIKTVGDLTYFAESEFRSAPYFDINIDGITYLNVAF